MLADYFSNYQFLLFNFLINLALGTYFGLFISNTQDQIDEANAETKEMSKEEKENLLKKLRSKKDAYIGFCVIYIILSVTSLIASIIVKSKNSEGYKNTVFIILSVNVIFNFIVGCCVAYYNSFVSESGLFGFVLVFSMAIILQLLLAASKTDSEGELRQLNLQNTQQQAQRNSIQQQLPSNQTFVQQQQPSNQTIEQEGGRYNKYLIR